MKPLIDEVKSTINDYGMLEGGETVLVGVSGGPDSLALLYILRDLAPQFALSLHVFHLNHMMRGQAGADDAVFVEQTAESLGLPSTIMEADVPAYILANKTSPEDGARQVRYRLLEEIADEIAADRIALGHTAADRVETYLMRVIRGAGLDGLRSIPPVNGDIIRPLIETTREAVVAYCAGKGLQPVMDETNKETVYLRNKIRGELIPLLEAEYNPAIKDDIARQINAIEADVEVLDDLTQIAWDEVAASGDTGIVLNRAALIDLPLSLQRRIIRLASTDLVGEPSPLTFQGVADILEKVVRGASGSALDLPGGLTVRREYDTIIIEPVSEVPADDTPDFPAAVLHVPGVTRLDLLDMSIDCLTAGPEAVDSEIGNDVAFLDAGVIKGRGLVRPPKAGDRVRPFGMSGVKKLSDIFIDTKTPRRVRRMTPVVEFDGNIVWIAGYCIDDRYKVTEETRKVMVLRLLKGSS